MGMPHSRPEIKIWDVYKKEINKLGKDFPFAALKIQQAKLITPDTNLDELVSNMFQENISSMEKHLGYMIDSEKEQISPILYEMRSFVNVLTAPDSGVGREKLDELCVTCLYPMIQKIIGKLVDIDVEANITPDAELRDYLGALENLSYNVSGPSNPIKFEPIEPDYEFLTAYRAAKRDPEFARSTLMCLNMMAHKFRDVPIMLRYLHLMAAMIGSLTQTYAGGVWGSDSGGLAEDARELRDIGPASYGLEDSLFDRTHREPRYGFLGRDNCTRYWRTLMLWVFACILIGIVLNKNDVNSNIVTAWGLYTLGSTLAYLVLLYRERCLPWQTSIPQGPYARGGDPFNSFMAILKSGRLTQHNLGEFRQSASHVGAIISNSIRDMIKGYPDEVNKNLDAALVEVSTSFIAMPERIRMTPEVKTAIKLMALSTLNRLNDRRNMGDPIPEPEQYVFSQLNHIASQIVTVRDRPVDFAPMTEREILDFMKSGDISSNKIQTTCAYMMKKYRAYPILANYIENISAIIESLDTISIAGGASLSDSIATLAKFGVFCLGVTMSFMASGIHPNEVMWAVKAMTLLAALNSFIEKGAPGPRNSNRRPDRSQLSFLDTLYGIPGQYSGAGTQGALVLAQKNYKVIVALTIAVMLVCFIIYICKLAIYKCRLPADAGVAGRCVSGSAPSDRLMGCSAPSDRLSMSAIASIS